MLYLTQTKKLLFSGKGRCIMTKLTNENFEKEVLNYKGKVLIDFNAIWCGPCRMMEPVLKQFEGNNPHIKVCTVDTDEQQELTMKYDVHSIPMFLAVEDGNVVGKTVGVSSEEELLSLFG